MRSRILAIKTTDGWFRLNKVFPPVKNPDGSVEKEDLTVTHIEQIELADSDGDLYGFYSVWAAAPDNSELTVNGTMILYQISYDQVQRVIHAVPAEDCKIRWEAFAKTLGVEYRELPNDLPRERLLAQQAIVEKALKALDDEDEKDDEPDPVVSEPTTEARDANPQTTQVSAAAGKPADAKPSV